MGDVILNIIGVAPAVFIGIIAIIAVVRVIIKTKKGEPVRIEPVGVNRDLPGDITGLNEHK